jgi:hypothetical protein
MRRLLLLLLLLAGCAKFPSTGSSNFTKRLVFTMQVDGALRTGLEQGGNGLPYVYVIALRLSTDPNPPDQGPIPVVVPSGNGIVAGNATHFILWNPLVSPQFQIMQFEDATMNEWFQTGVPINYMNVTVGDDTLTFEIDLSQLVPAADVPTIQSVQVNFLTMNNTNTSGGGRVWDALGDSTNPGEINSYFTLQPNSAFTYTNANTGNVEPQGDVVDPDLDIVDWSIEVRLP